ncbi:carbon-nitrogen hydrolase [Coniophora puteana RWD-64-598 SS2]|uniref:Carbon-nitrogen hydrolase n=1 Tax=Coniophora puteana (strain RWD-64-598) TaxID=741705 RepID=A0A5M3N675_CONPW|nr:carbon-nitrogen hydrolase [Coniophora puteana RWD-64-598 SS2]EIW86806.1 carbon-nitrogen hydrolase [Coniophora puteana RWD-64-598 SS2]
MAGVIRASVVQTCTAAYSLENTLSKFEILLCLAKERDGAQLAVFPEAFIGGYPKMSHFGAVVGERSDSGRDEFLRYYQGAIEIPSPTISRIEAACKEHNVFVVMGVIEKDLGTLYCTAIFVDPVAGLVAKHRKLVPTGTERIIWGQGDGSTLPVLEARFDAITNDNPAGREATRAKISAAICWENYMPLLRTYYYSLGTQLYCAPTVDARPQWQSTMTHIALEGRCFVLSACQFAKEADYPPDHAVADKSNRNADNIMISGGSVIVSPLGEILAGPSREPETILTADLDLDQIARGKFDLDVCGHYARTDIFQLHTRTQSNLEGYRDASK